MVVATHARYYLDGTSWQAFGERFLRPGAQGVDLFFLVSGFIMVHTTARSPGGARDAAVFLAKRFARIWPVYAVMVGITLVLQQLWVGHMSSPGAVVRSLLFLPVSTHSPPQFDLPLPVGWTLNFEWYFYLVFGLSLLAGRWRWAAFFSWMIATLVALPLALTGTVSLLPDHDYAIGIGVIDQNVNPIVWDFIAGVLIGLLHRSDVRIGNRLLLNALVAAALAFAWFWSFAGMVKFHGMANYGIIQWGLSMAILFAALALAFKDSEPRVPRMLVWLGGCSYSLYLLHLLVFGTVEHLMSALGYEQAMHGIVFVLLLMPIPVIYAGISRRYLEDGLAVAVRRKLLRMIGPRRITVAQPEAAQPVDAGLQ